MFPSLPPVTWKRTVRARIGAKVIAKKTREFALVIRFMLSSLISLSIFKPRLKPNSSELDHECARIYQYPHFAHSHSRI